MFVVAERCLLSSFDTCFCLLVVFPSFCGALTHPLLCFRWLYRLRIAGKCLSVFFSIKLFTFVLCRLPFRLLSFFACSPPASFIISTVHVLFMMYALPVNSVTPILLSTLCQGVEQGVVHTCTAWCKPVLKDWGVLPSVIATRSLSE